MASSSFNYQQLNSVARDPVAVDILKKDFLAVLEKFQSNIDPSSAAFKNVVNTANEVWAGADKDTFIKNLKASASTSSEQIKVLINDIKKYLPADVKEFESLQAQTNRIASQKVNQ